MVELVDAESPYLGLAAHDAVRLLVQREFEVVDTVTVWKFAGTQERMLMEWLVELRLRIVVLAVRTWMILGVQLQTLVNHSVFYRHACTTTSFNIMNKNMFMLQRSRVQIGWWVAGLGPQDIVVPMGRQVYVAAIMMGVWKVVQSIIDTGGTYRRMKNLRSPIHLHLRKTEILLFLMTAFHRPEVGRLVLRWNLILDTQFFQMVRLVHFRLLNYIINK